MYKSLFLCSLLLLASCSSISEEPYHPLEMFVENYGVGITFSPPYIDPDQPNSVVLSAYPLFSGKGVFFVVGHGGLNPVGQIVSPVNQELGNVIFPVVFEKGKKCEFPWMIQINPNSSHIGMSLQAVYDSLLIDGIHYSINSPESRNLIGGDASYSIGGHITLDAEVE